MTDAHLLPTHRVATRRSLPSVIACALLVAVASPAAAQSFVTVESGQVRPLALAPDGTRLFAVNTPDAQLEIFDVDGAGLHHTGSVPVGLEPVTVAARSADEVWVVNHLSDSVSIVDVGSDPPRVVRTLLVGDEPRDLVFAGAGGTRAFITTAHRGQNSPVDPQLTTPGVGRADVWVFDATALGSTLGGSPLTVITLFGDTPRALAVSPDGNTVYAAVFHSGNRTTTISDGLVCNGGAAAGTCVVGGITLPGGMPGPRTNVDGVTAPETGLIVKFNPASGAWEDTLARDWTNAVMFSVPDKDVFAISATATPPTATGVAYSGVGTVLFNMAVNPVSGALYVSNTEARNEVRFEGPGKFGGSTVRGHLHEARVSILQSGTTRTRHLNKHINYDVVPSPSRTKAASLAIPVGLAVSDDGSMLYVAAFGSSKVGIFDTAALEGDTFVPDADSQIPVSGGGPSGLVLDETHARLYVLTRFNNAVAVVDTQTKREVRSHALHNPEPATVTAGRRFLYDATLTSSNGEASCASCHIFGDLDSLAWDLGNPDDSVLNNPNPFRVGPIGNPDFHPMKGPMTTQSLRGMANHGPMHWRGDRTGGDDPGGSALDEDAAFKKFNVAFEGLLGRTKALTDTEMQAFTDFILQVTYPPNPIRALDNSLTTDQAAGRNFFLNSSPSDTAETCDGCHTLDPESGFFGSDGFSSFEGEPQHLKVPHLRNMYQKVGMFGMASVQFFNAGDNGHKGEQIRSFGFLHDGSVDTLFRFHQATLFNKSALNAGGFSSDAQRRQVEAFMFAFDSNLAPIVGQQVTLTSTNAATVASRLDLLIARADAGECDVIVKGTVAGEQRGAYRTAAGRFQTDRTDEPPLADSTLRALATTTGQELTYTCVPPGSGERSGVDRDEDGVYDRDEADLGSDPADPYSLPVTCTNGGVLSRPTLKVSRNRDPAGDENLALSGQWVVTPSTPAIDPAANGIQFKVTSADGATLFDRTMPGGTAWTRNAAGTQWNFKDAGGTLAKGITKAVVTAKSAGVLRVSVTGKRSDFQVDESQLPVGLIVVLGGADQGDAGQCASIAFNAATGTKPRCTVSGTGNVVNCR